MMRLYGECFHMKHKKIMCIINRNMFEIRNMYFLSKKFPMKNFFSPMKIAYITINIINSFIMSNGEYD